MTRWGILATGRIARSFADNLLEVPGAEVAAVGSRSQESAEEFARPYGARAHASYEALVADPDVDVVYIATPHSFHLDNARMAFAAGKHVLCEKPLTLNLPEAEAMVAAAREAGLFLMEAMWMACHPVIRAIVEGLREGRYGEARQVHAGIGFVVPPDASARMRDPALGAGAQQDMGIYPLTFAHLVLGAAEQLAATAVVNDDGVDADIAIAGRHGRAVSALTASMTSVAATNASVATTTGRIDIAKDFHHPAYASWTPKDGEPVRIDGLEPVIGTGLGNEAGPVEACPAAGGRQCPRGPRCPTLTLIRQLDEVRRQIGVSYASDS
jgi:predicted dehydrogenase